MPLLQFYFHKIRPVAKGGLEWGGGQPPKFPSFNYLQYFLSILDSSDCNTIVIVPSDAEAAAFPIAASASEIIQKSSRCFDVFCHDKK